MESRGYLENHFLLATRVSTTGSAYFRTCPPAIGIYDIHVPRPRHFTKRNTYLQTVQCSCKLTTSLAFPVEFWYLITGFLPTKLICSVFLEHILLEKKTFRTEYEKEKSLFNRSDVRNKPEQKIVIYCIINYCIGAVVCRAASVIKNFTV